MSDGNNGAVMESAGKDTDEYRLPTSVVPQVRVQIN